MNNQILSVMQKENFFLLSPGSLNNEMWFVIKYAPDENGYELKENDTLKLGRVLLKIKKISAGEPPKKKPLSDSLVVSDMSQKDLACKICCCDESNSENPLISPCKCIGSMKFIHLFCLRKWLESKITSRSAGCVTSYFWSDFICELCKTPLPSTVNYKGNMLELISIVYPGTPHMVIEDQRPEEDHHQILHVVEVNPGNYATLGRGHDCDIRISDISVSRNHSRIRLYRGKFYVQDTKSKFGTLLGLRSEICLFNGQSIALQISRTLLKVTMKKDWTFSSVFCCQSEKNVLPLYKAATIANDQ